MPNPNPSPKTRFQPGQSGNPGGLSSETAGLIRENAESAARIRAQLLQATEASLKKRDTDKVMELIESAMLKMLKDSEDRGLGAPVQSMDHTTNGKDMPTQILIRAADDNGND